jgi:hypothetical protein
MSTLQPPTPRPADPQATAALETTLGVIDTELDALGDALRQRDSAAIEAHADGLHKALARALDLYGRASRQGAVPAPLRSRLASASGKVAAQRESLSRATAALDRAIDVLLPRDPVRTVTYGSDGSRYGTRFGA